MILVLAGASWRPPVGLDWLIPVAYLVLRYAGLRLAVPLALRTVGDDPAPSRAGEAMLAQGGLAAADLLASLDYHRSLRTSCFTLNRFHVYPVVLPMAADEADIHQPVVVANC